MKILVNNKREQELIERFLEAMNELEMVDELEKLDYETSEGDETLLQGDDNLFITTALSKAKVIVDESVYPICVEHYHLVGTCVDCGTQTEGTLDGDDISYDEWLDKTSEQSLKEWRCEKCYFKHEEDDNG